VREYVRERKRHLGLIHRDTFVPQSYAWGWEAQMDWYETYADLSGERQKLQVFSLRGAWRVVRRSIGLIRGRPSRRFWKPMSWPFGTVGESSITCVMTTSPRL